jgi:hypothetical protein
VRKSYQNGEIDTSQPAVPDTVSVSLAELAGELREGLLALAVGTGLQVVVAIMEEDRPFAIEMIRPMPALIDQQQLAQDRFELFDHAF